MDFLDEFIKNLLHLEDGKSNKLIDLGDLTCNTSARGNDKTYLLTFPGRNAGEMMLNTIRERRGKSSNQTALHNSAQVPSPVAGSGAKWMWQDLNGLTSAESLHKFIENVYSELNLKGNNPLFLSVGAICWDALITDKLEKVYSPLLIFPVRLVRGSPTSPVEIDFVDDDAYFNPCFINLLRNLYPSIAGKFPHPNGEGIDFDQALDLEILSDGNKYFQAVEDFIKNNVTVTTGQELAFTLDRNAVAISVYNHSDICMYYDVRRNRQRINGNKLIAKVFGLSDVTVDEVKSTSLTTDMKFVLPKDSVQEKLISRVAQGESLIIKGPPGTGKTLTIANMIAVLLAQGKRVMFASKKLSALAEVSNKLPENLRKFVMMLAYETEKQASNFKPATIREEFREILRYKREYSRDTSLVTKLNSAIRSKSDAFLNLVEYFKRVFGDVSFAGKNYYDALDTYYQHADLPVVNFAPAEELVNTTTEQLQHAKALIAEAGKHFAKIKCDGTVKRSPWLNVCGNVDIENGLYPAYTAICNQLPDIFATLNETNGEIALNELQIGIITALNGQKVLTADDVLKVLSITSDTQVLDGLLKAKTHYEAKKQFATHSVMFYDDGDQLKDLLSLQVDDKLTVSQLSKIVDCKSILYKDGKLAVDGVAMGKLIEAVDKISAKQIVARENQLNAITVFDKPLTDKQVKLILKSYEILKDFTSGQKPTFKASHTAKKLATLSSNPLVNFEQIVKATVEYYNYYESNNDIEVLRRLMTAILQTDAQHFDEDKYQAFALIVNNSRAMNLSVDKYFSQVEVAYNYLTGNPAIKILTDSLTVKDIANAYDFCLAERYLNKVVVDCCNKAQVQADNTDPVTLNKVLMAVFDLGRYPQVAAATNEQKQTLINTLIGIDKQVIDKLLLVISQLDEIRNKYVLNYYTVAPHTLTANDLQIFASLALDRSVAGSAIRYYEITHQLQQVLPVGKLLEALEQDEIQVEENLFAALLEHSFLSIVINHRLKLMGNARNGLGRQAVANLEKLDEAEKEILRLNAKLIEQACLEKINPDDQDFAFLKSDKGAQITMRGLFKTYAQAVWKLKRCFILSPSTASVLFRPEIYFDFDVVIVDEASQLEPVYLLPILMRSKQCVLVGDEHQMPPITHFKAKTVGLINDYDRELTIDKDISALSLALVNHAFDTTELICHYRSNTESLIAFSQRAFYPFMRTFPAAVPFGEGLGFTDVLVSGGYCEGGVNPPEAQQTVELLRAHFDKYFDEDKGRLHDNAAVGVVAFGQAQLDAIIRLVERDEQLNRRIARARNAVDVGDKAVFFRTIESVQGQETDHLILSLTYGKDKNGKAQNRFGELNRDAFGKCIFNVAVTRARSSVTLVRSVEPYELDGDSRIGFIVDYINLVKQFSVANKQQFVSKPLGKGAHFVNDVVRYVQSLGVSPERIVTGYGVTDGSILIPIAILSEDLSRAELGIWCELPVERKYDFLDYNLRYYNSLINRSWCLHRISIHEWFDNNEAEQKLLKNKIEKIL